MNYDYFLIRTGEFKLGLHSRMTDITEEDADNVRARRDRRRDFIALLTS